jgi:hypothetical protein
VSEQTARELEKLKAAEAEQRAATDDLKRECVESVARGLPDRLDAYAKRLAHQQPDVAKELGREGIDALRKELAEAAEQIATDLRGAVEQIEWPATARRSQDVHSALFKFMYGQRVARLTAILKTHGFFFHETGGILPQDLYDQNSFGELVDALQALERAAHAAATAKAADDRDAVESLWDGR